MHKHTSFLLRRAVHNFIFRNIHSPHVSERAAACCSSSCSAAHPSSASHTNPLIRSKCSPDVRSTSFLSVHYLDRSGPSHRRSPVRSSATSFPSAGPRPVPSPQRSSLLCLCFFWSLLSHAVVVNDGRLSSVQIERDIPVVVEIGRGVDCRRSE